MEYTNFDCEIADGRARLRLIGPDAPDLGELCDEFVDLMARLQEDNAVRMILITDGDHSFELHHHLDGLAEAHADGGGFDTLAADDDICGRIITVIRECSKPVVAALIPGWGLFHTLPGLMGQGRALEFLWSGRTVGATEAWQVGLVDRLLDDEVFEDELDAIVARLRTLPQPAVRLTKLGMQQTQELDMTSMLAYEWETQQQCWSSPETAEGMSAWRDGRDPVLDAPTQPEED